jgi:hypothetical protein
VVLEDDVEGRGGDVPAVEMDLIMALIEKDLRAKVSRHLASLTAEMHGMHELLARLIGEP